MFKRIKRHVWVAKVTVTWIGEGTKDRDSPVNAILGVFTNRRRMHEVMLKRGPIERLISDANREEWVTETNNYEWRYCFERHELK